MKQAGVLVDKGVLEIDEKVICKRIKQFIVEQVDRSGTDGVVVGMSGGIDSSVVTALCTEAFGPSRVLGLLMPTQVSAEEDMEDASQLGDRLGILQERVDIQPLVGSFKEALGVYDESDRISIGNLMPRIRMTVLYYYANSLNMLVAGTGNRSELLIGYFTKYGDGGVDILPIGQLYKTQVRQLARFLDIPERIISKKPSAGLWPGQTDEGEIGVDYEVLDLVLHGLIDLRLNPKVVGGELGLPEDIVSDVLNTVKRTEHKLRMPLIAPV